MTLNKKCLYKSLKKDYTEIGKYIVIILGVCIGIWIGCLFKSDITNAISNVHASYATSAIMIIVTATMLFDSASDLSSRSTVHNIVAMIFVNLFLLLLSFLVYVCCLKIMGYSSSYVGNYVGNVFCVSFIYETAIVMVGLWIPIVIVTPLCTAYARCKLLDKLE